MLDTVGRHDLGCFGAVGGDSRGPLQAVLSRAPGRVPGLPGNLAVRRKEAKQCCRWSSGGFNSESVVRIEAPVKWACCWMKGYRQVAETSALFSFEPPICCESVGGIVRGMESEADGSNQLRV